MKTQSVLCETLTLEHRPPQDSVVAREIKKTSSAVTHRLVACQTCNSVQKSIQQRDFFFFYSTLHTYYFLTFPRRVTKDCKSTSIKRLNSSNWIVKIRFEKPA